MDSEFFKVILQGGSFGLLAVAVVWMLFWGSPMIEKTISKLGEDHKQAVKEIMEEQERVSAEHRISVATLNAEHRAAIAALTTEQTRVVVELDKNCREERREALKVFNETVKRRRTDVEDSQ